MSELGADINVELDVEDAEFATQTPGMLDLLPAHVDGFLTLLNEPQAVKEWRELLTTYQYKHHLSMEDHPYDTDSSEFHRMGCALVDDQVKRLKQSQYEDGQDASRVPFSMLNLLSCVDVFAISAASLKQSYRQDKLEWVIRQTGKRPLLAARVGCTLFYMPGSGKARWEARPWGGDDEVMMLLPYQRKYDSERHGRADDKLRRDYERLEVANDLLGVYSERLDESVPTADGKFSWPEREDIDLDLERLGLGFGMDQLSGFAGTVSLDLFTVRTELREVDGKLVSEKRYDHTVATGSYDGALGGYHRRKSGAFREVLSPSSVKWMAQSSLSGLRRELNLCTGR